MIKKIYVVNGAPASGKTTFERMAQEELGESRCAIISIIDSIKEIAKFCGWNEQNKRPEDRKLLSDLKDALDTWGNYSINKLIQAINGSDEDVIFVDCRSPYDIDKLKEYYIDEVKTIFVTAGERQEEQAILNHADADVLNYNYDYFIDNSGSYSDLRDTVQTFIEVENI